MEVTTGGGPREDSGEVGRIGEITPGQISRVWEAGGQVRSTGRGRGPGEGEEASGKGAAGREWDLGVGLREAVEPRAWGS